MRLKNHEKSVLRNGFNRAYRRRYFRRVMGVIDVHVRAVYFPRFFKAAFDSLEVFKGFLHYVFVNRKRVANGNRGKDVFHVVSP